MIGSVSSNRRANAFARALGAPETPEEQSQAGTAEGFEPGVASEPGETLVPDKACAPHPAEDDEHRALLTVVEELGELPKPELDPEVKGIQRAQLIAAMEREFAGGQVPEQRQGAGRGAHRAQPQRALGRLRPKSRLGRGLAAGGLTVGVAAGAFGGVAAASTDALPGDRLYGLKRGMEDFKLDLAGDDSARGRLHLDHASTRMHEARRLMERGKSGPLDDGSLGQVRRALGSLSSNAAEGRRLLGAAYSQEGDLGSLRSLSAFADAHREGWTSLRERLPAELEDVRDEVSSVLDAINEDVAHVRELSPDQPAPAHQPGSGPRSSPGSHAPGPDATDGRADGRPNDSDQGSSGQDASESPGDDASQDESPRPSESGEGLLGGSGGLLDPPGRDDDSIPRPDITIPPLLPGGLPGLGLESGQDD